VKLFPNLFQGCEWHYLPQRQLRFRAIQIIGTTTVETMPLQLTDLLSNGYFPKELPPPFTTASYAQALAGPGATAPAGAIAAPPHYSMQYTHNLVRIGGLRRNLGVPNPKHFFRLAEHITRHWTNFTAFTTGSPYSLTKPVDGRPDRAITPEHSLGERTSFRARLRSPARFILKADISRFFPSIYTHSIPWALMGKAAAKAAHAARTLSGTWEDTTDVLVRSTTNNQTVGIPIGPDTSRLLAEVVLSRVDVELAGRVAGLRGIRYIDDYEFAFATRSEAEQTLSHLQHLLNEFELALNPSKTAILELPEGFDPAWTGKIRLFPFRKAGTKGQRNDLTAYFDMVFALLKQFPDEVLLKYAIARLRDQEIQPANLRLFENILSHCVIIEPACLPQVCDQIVYYLGKGYPPRAALWDECLNRIIYERVPLGQSSEAVWAMWLLKILNIRLTSNSEQAINNSEDSTVALMGLGLATLGMANPASFIALHRFGNAAHLYQHQWLLCYQGNYMGWLGPASGRAVLRTDPVMQYLESQNVSFFDISVPAPAPVRHGLLLVGGGGGNYEDMLLQR